MIPPEVIGELREEYDEIFATTIGRREVVFRTLTYAEMDKFTKHKEWSSADAEDAIVNAAVIWPVDFDLDKVPPGHISSLAEEIIESSHFLDIEEARDIFLEKRLQMQEARFVMKAMCLVARNELGLTAEDLDNMTYVQLAEITALAEQIVQIKKAMADPSVEIALNIMGGEEELLQQMPSQQFESINTSNDETYAPGATGTAAINDPIALKLKQALGQI